MKPVSSYTDIDELKKLMTNAKRLGREDVYRSAFERRCELEGIEYSDPLHRDFHATLAAYEELLAEKHGHRQAAGYTRRKMKDKGIERCLEDWAIDTKETDGFKTLIERGLVKLTGEYLVSKYPDRFSEAARAGARRRLSQYGHEGEA